MADWIWMNAIWGGQWAGRDTGVLDGDPHPKGEREDSEAYRPLWFEWRF